jgi:hypothetical protein
MSNLSIMEIGNRLTQAGKLDARPVCVYGSEMPPANAIPVASISRCIAKAILTIAVHKDTPPLYMGNETLEGCCQGGQGWLGFKSFPPYVKYFVSKGSKDFRNGAAEYLKASPDIVEENIGAIGKIVPIGKFIVFQDCKDLSGEDPGVRSIVCFGIGEQIRNLCALIHFRSLNPFYSVLTPWGPSCATFVTYPAGMAENAPFDTVFMGPVDPTGNSWFPENYMALGIPISVARRMSTDLEDSFIIKRPKTAYPEHRTELKSANEK